MGEEETVQLAVVEEAVRLAVVGWTDPEPQPLLGVDSSSFDYRRRLLGHSEAWRDKAACAGMGPELFFPVGDRTAEAVQQTTAAKAVCAVCPVRRHCLAWALAANAESGVWGGLSAMERRRLRRLRIRRRQAKAAQLAQAARPAPTATARALFPTRP